MTIYLLPFPQSVKYSEQILTLPQRGNLVLDVPCPLDFLFTAQRARQAFEVFAGTELEISGSHHLPSIVRITVNSAIRYPQGYRLSINEEGIYIAGKDPAGVFYAINTLIQLLQTCGDELPQLVIDDYPDFPARGVMLDISRNKVPTMETLYGLVDLLAGWKINQIQLYTEHTFAYHHHVTVWQDASPMTPSEILALDAYCQERFIELVPNQNSFGHMHRWLRHPEYLYLAETEVGMPTPWGRTMEYPFSLSPASPETLPFLETLFDELLPNFSSEKFNVGADETFDLGMGRSKQLVEAKGKGRVYLDFLLEIYERVKARNHTMLLWGDIINQYPELVPMLPKDAIVLEWGYEAAHDFAGKSALFAACGIPYYVCPGTSSWTSLGGRTDNCMANIRNAFENGLKNGAVGVLNTDWGDNGHWQPLSVSYPGFAYGAALSWCYGQNADMDVPLALDTFVFRDKAHVLGQLTYDLGNGYLKAGASIHNGSLLFWLYLRSAEDYAPDGETALIQNLINTIAYIDDTISPLESAQAQSPDRGIIVRELALAAMMMNHGAKRGLLMLEHSSVDAQSLLKEFNTLYEEFQGVWLARNRSGGLSDSLALLGKGRELYLNDSFR